MQDNGLDLMEGLESAWEKVVGFVPSLLGFLAILVIGWILAKLLAKGTDTVLERVGFDQAVERGGVKQALARSRYDASDLVAKLVYYTVLLFTLTLAFGQFGPNNPVSQLLAGVVAFLPRVVVAIVIVVVAAAIAKAVKDIVSNLLGGMSYGNALGAAAGLFILGLGIIAAVQQVGVAERVASVVVISVFATVGGILVVGVGGGLVSPMSRRWETWLDRAEAEAGRVREQVQQNKRTAQATVQGYAAQAGGASPGSAAAETRPISTPVAGRSGDTTQKNPPSE